MFKPLTTDLAMPLYEELPSLESKLPDIESDFVSASESDAYGRLECSLLVPLGDDIQPLYVRG